MSQRIGIDYLPALTHAPGIGRYSRELVRALAPLAPRPELRLFAIGGGARCFGEVELGLEGARNLCLVDRRWPRRAVRALGRLGLGAERWLGGVDLFHALLPDYPPLTGTPRTLAVAELPPEGSDADRILAAACRGSLAVIVFSRYYRRRVAERYDLDPGSLHFTPVGCEHWARVELPPEPPPPRPRILTLGAVRHARRPLLVLSAFEILRRGGIDAELWIVGRAADAAGSLRAALAASPHRQAVRWIEEPREAEMPRLMARSSLLLHLAVEEGSPVTPLEAFRAGKPVVAEDLPAFREALGELAEWIAPPGDPLAVAEALARTLSRSDPAGAKERVARARSFTWEATARATLSAWDWVFDSGKMMTRRRE